MGRKRKWFRILLLCVFSLAIGTGAAGVRSAAAEGEAYTYTIRIYAGQQGTVGGGEVKVYEGLAYEDRVTFNLREVALLDGSKYYVKGLRESGRDNNTVMENASFTVNGDRDYVVAYGLLNDAVAYTIHYQDAEGNTLAPDETYYGNVGDKPVIAYLYIEGYQPQAYNLTKTLDANAAENVFTFIYSPVATEPEETTSAAEPGTEESSSAADTPGGGAGTDNPGGDEPGGDEPGGDNPGGEVDIPDPEVPLDGPAEVQDLDIPDSEVPLAGRESDSSSVSILNGNALLVRIPGPVKGCVLILLLGIIFLAVRKAVKAGKEKET